MFYILKLTFLWFDIKKYTFKTFLKLGKIPWRLNSKARHYRKVLKFKFMGVSEM